MLIYSGNPTTNGTDIQLPYCPALLLVNVTTITRIKVNVLGTGVVVDLNTASIIQKLGTLGQVAGTDLLLAIPVANGVFGGKNTTITIANDGAIQLFATAFGKGSYYFRSVQQVVLANSGYNFVDFQYLTLAAVGVDDEINFTWADGTVQKMSRTELVYLAKTQSNVSFADDTFVINNLNGQIRNFNYIPTAERQVAITQIRRN